MTAAEVKEKLLRAADVLTMISSEMHALSHEVKQHSTPLGWSTLGVGSHCMTAVCDLHTIAGVLEEHLGRQLSPGEPLTYPVAP